MPLICATLWLSSHFLFFLFLAVWSCIHDVCSIIMCAIIITGALSTFMSTGYCLAPTFLHSITITGALSLHLLCTINTIFKVSVFIHAIHWPHLIVCTPSSSSALCPSTSFCHHYHLHVVPSFMSFFEYTGIKHSVFQTVLNKATYFISNLKSFGSGNLVRKSSCICFTGT